MNIPKINDEYIYGKGDLFSVVIIFKYLLSKDDFRLLMAELSYEIDALSGKLKVVSIDKVLAKMGFPINYKSLFRYGIGGSSMEEDKKSKRIKRCNNCGYYCTCTCCNWGYSC